MNPFEYRCAKCGLEEEVLVGLPEDESREYEEPSMHGGAALALAWRRCPRCGKRDLATVALKVAIRVVVTHLIVGAIQVMLMIADRTIVGLDLVLGSGIWAVVVFEVGVVSLMFLSILHEGSSAIIRPRR